MAITNQIPKKLAIELMPKARQISSEDSFQWQAEPVVWLYSKHQRSLFTVKPGLNSFHSRCRASFDIHSDAKENKPWAKSASQEIPTSAILPQHNFPFWALFWPQLQFYLIFMFWYMLWWATLHSPLLHFDKRQARTRQRNPSKKRCKNGVHGLSLTIFTSSHGICNANLQTWDILGFRTFDAKALAPVAKDCARQGPTAQSLQAPCKLHEKIDKEANHTTSYNLLLLRQLQIAEVSPSHIGCDMSRKTWEIHSKLCSNHNPEENVKNLGLQKDPWLFTSFVFVCIETRISWCLQACIFQVCQCLWNWALGQGTTSASFQRKCSKCSRIITNYSWDNLRPSAFLDKHRNHFGHTFEGSAWICMNLLAASY
jgi:hypothetical protein